MMSSFGHNNVLGSEPNQDLHVFLADVEFVLGAEDFKREGGDGTSELNPAVVSGEGVGDSFSPAGAEGKGLEADADPGDGPLGDEGWILMWRLMVPLPTLRAIYL